VIELYIESRKAVYLNQSHHDNIRYLQEIHQTILLKSRLCLYFYTAIRQQQVTVFAGGS